MFEKVSNREFWPTRDRDPVDHFVTERLATYEALDKVSPLRKAGTDVIEVRLNSSNSGRKGVCDHQYSFRTDHKMAAMSRLSQILEVQFLRYLLGDDSGNSEPPDGGREMDRMVKFEVSSGLRDGAFVGATTGCSSNN